MRLWSRLDSWAVQLGRPFFLEDLFMKHSHRHAVSKGKSAAKFRHGASKTHPRNMQMRPMRGGFRL